MPSIEVFDRHLLLRGYPPRCKETILRWSGIDKACNVQRRPAPFCSRVDVGVVMLQKTTHGFCVICLTRHVQRSMACSILYADSGVVTKERAHDVRVTLVACCMKSSVSACTLYVDIGSVPEKQLHDVCMTSEACQI